MDIMGILNLVYMIPFSSLPELDVSPMRMGLASRASAMIFISSAFSRENASTLPRTFMINTVLSLRPTTSKHMLRMLMAEETSNPALARMARVVLTISSLVMFC